MEAAGAHQAVLFSFHERKSSLSSIEALGFTLLPDPAVIHLFPHQIQSLLATPGPVSVNNSTSDSYLSSRGNVAPELFKCLCPLKVREKLVGLIALGRRHGDAPYDDDALVAFRLLSHYVALSIQNYTLSQTLAERVSENMRLLASMHKFSDAALEAFAITIDIKHVSVHGHSLRVGRYAAAIGEVLGKDAAALASLRSAGYLHDIGMVAIDKGLLSKNSRLDVEEFREMRQHTIIGHEIVSQVQFPWEQIPEIVRWHHERADGSGYPDGLHGEEIPQAVRIVALADTFDAMISERPYRERLPVGVALQELIRLTPQKYDPQVLQALLIQVRRDAIGTNHLPVFEREAIELSAVEVDRMASVLQNRISEKRIYLT